MSFLFLRDAPNFLFFRDSKKKEIWRESVWLWLNASGARRMNLLAARPVGWSRHAQTTCMRMWVMLKTCLAINRRGLAGNLSPWVMRPVQWTPMRHRSVTFAAPPFTYRGGVLLGQRLRALCLETELEKRKKEKLRLSVSVHLVKGDRVGTGLGGKGMFHVV